MPLAHRQRTLWTALGFALIVALAQLLISSQAAAAPPDGLSLAPVSARNEPNALGGGGVVKGAPVDTFKYIVNLDNTGTTETRSPTGPCSPLAAGYPESCGWTSIAGVPGSSPIVTQGDQDDFAAGAVVNLPQGRYLVSVLADNYKLDGEHFTVDSGGVVHGPLNSAGQLIVELQPAPIPDSTVRALVFEDNAPVNSAPDVPAEAGLPNFEGQLVDYIGQLITDVYGNPICTLYEGEDPVTHEIADEALDPDGLPVVAADQSPAPGEHSSPGHCRSNDDGILTIPHMGTNRYALSVIAPNGTDWIQTTTLEGNHDWDSWNTEGNTGFDTEFVIAGEPVPTAVFGFVRPQNDFTAGPAGKVTGVVNAVKIYVPTVGGLTGNLGDVWNGLNGGRIDKPIDRPYVALSDLDNGDQAVYVGRGAADGSFTINNVPDGNYTLTWWDEPQDYILDIQNVTVSGGQVEDLGILPLTEWWTQLEGHVFNDLNSNGKRDAGEPGIAGFPIVMKKRENSVMDRGAVATTTAPDGSYYMENVYPMTQWLVMEAYDDRYYTTGITYQADNQPDETTVLGAGVDVSVLPIIGLGGRVDWGVKPYAPGTNGGIVGTVSYDTTRNELDPRFAAVEDWQPGIPDLPVNLYEPVPCGTHAGAPCDTTPAGDEYEVVASGPDAGAYVKGKLVNQYITETWTRPGVDANANGDGECIARNADGGPLVFDTNTLVADQQVTDSSSDCLEGPLMGVQMQKGFSTVDGNYGFGDACLVSGFDPEAGACVDPDEEPAALGIGDYLVEVGIPTDDTPEHRPLYKVTREEDINIGNGDQTIPQIPPPACAGPLHTVDNLGIGTDGYGPVTDPNGITGVTVPASTPTDNPTFNDIEGSPYEGMQKPLCDTKLVHVSDRRSIAPTFNLFTDVPIPGRFWGLLVNDLNFSADKTSLLYGEKAGIPFGPVGIYDYTNRLVTTVESDFNGLFDVLLPSTNRINCPTPSGVCANVYRFVGNDPGVPGRLNVNYKPEFRTIAAEFEAFPGLLVPADLAPTQVGVSVELPGGQTHRVVCALDSATPQLFAVSKPYVDTRVASDDTVVIKGQGFGNAPGAVTLDGTIVLGTSAAAWSDTQVTVTVPATTAQGPHQLDIVAPNGQKTVNGLTFHVLGSSYDPHVYEVGPGKTYEPANSLPNTADHAIQNAIDAAAASTDSRPDLVVVYPGLATLDNPRVNPRGAYYENLVITRPVKLQGVGPGGIQTAGNTTVPGSIIDGGAFGGDGPVAGDWQTRVGDLTWDGNQNVNDGAVITLFAQSNAFPLSPSTNNAPTIDGLDLRGGDQQGFPNNINSTGGGGPTGLPPNIVTQGGAIFANAYVRALRITNNVVQNNGGGYGTIRIGTPDLPDPDNNNENVRIAKNRIIQNAGTNLAGGIGLFAGSDNYDIADNDICGNFSAEYGGGVSVYGLSPNGQIRGNRIYFNASYDEGGGIMIAGALPADPNALSPGSGAVTITRNRIQANLANDDGGGLRFLMAGNFPMTVTNNMIVNNVSTHEGGGVALDDAPQVRFVNNTVMKNLTTATAVTSNGLPAPAGLSTGANSTALQTTLPGGSPAFSNPLMFNNIFWDNRAGTRAGDTVKGLGMAGDPTNITYWDYGTADGSGTPASTNSLGAITSPSATGTNPTPDPKVVSTYDTSVDFAAWRTNPNFVGAILVATDLPPNLMGDYHLLNSTSPAYNIGAASKARALPGSGTESAPAIDFDNEPRPGSTAFDAGADEIPNAVADLQITNVPNLTAASPGQTVTYTVTVTNLGPGAVTGAPVTGTKASGSRLTVSSWTCSATAGSSCGAASGPITGTQTAFGLGSVSLAKAGSATIIVTGTVNGTSTSGSFTWTANVAAPGGVSDPVSGNNSAAAASVSIVSPGSDLSITKTDGQTAPALGSPLSYTVVVTNNGPLSGTVTARVTDDQPLGLNGMAWSCDSTAPGSDCDTSGSMGTDATGTGGINRQVRLAGGASLTFTVTGTAGATGTLRNSASVAMVSGGTDRNAANNTAVDTDTVALPVIPPPSLPVLDQFSRANANTLGPNWRQVVLLGQAAIRVNANRAFAALAGWAMWDTSLGANQGAALTFATAPQNSVALALKGTGGVPSTPTNYLRVAYASGAVTVSSLVSSNATARATFPVALANGDRLSAVAKANGSVAVYKNSTLVGVVLIPTSGSGAWTQGTGGGRIGVIMPTGQRIDDFGGGAVAP